MLLVGIVALAADEEGVGVGVGWVVGWGALSSSSETEGMISSS